MTLEEGIFHILLPGSRTRWPPCYDTQANLPYQTCVFILKIEHVGL